MRKAALAWLCAMAFVISGCAGSTGGNTITEPEKEKAAESASSAEPEKEKAAETASSAGPEKEKAAETAISPEPGSDPEQITAEEDDKETAEEDSGKNDAGSEETADSTLKNETAAAEEESGSDMETSPFILWGYEGYVDACDGYTWQKEFKNRDYDGDGKTDRVNRKWDQEEQTAAYTVEFGNGDRLAVPVSWETGFPHVYSGDLDDDGEKEILFTLTYDTSTDPMSFGEMWLFDRDASSGRFNEIELPFINIENGSRCLEIKYDKPEDNRIHYTVLVNGFTEDEEVDEDYVSMWWTDEETTEARTVFYAEIKEESHPVLRCYVAPLPRHASIIGFDLDYKNGRCEICNMGYDSPYEEADDEEYLQADNRSEETIPEYLVYVETPDGYANLRSGPGTKYSVIYQIPDGESLEVYREEATAENGKKWLKVAYYKSSDDDTDPWITGWIAESQLAK